MGSPVRQLLQSPKTIDRRVVAGDSRSGVLGLRYPIEQLEDDQPHRLHVAFKNTLNIIPEAP